MTMGLGLQAPGKQQADPTMLYRRSLAWVFEFLASACASAVCWDSNPKQPPLPAVLRFANPSGSTPQECASDETAAA
jgi:hypothetical protein